MISAAFRILAGVAICEREDFFLGCQVEPVKFDNMSATITWRTAEISQFGLFLNMVEDFLNVTP